MMIAGWPLWALALLFIGGAAVVWYAGVRLSNTTDVLAPRYGIGNALGGLIVLAFATDLPELTITISAAHSGALELAVGNLLGGVALQTVVLAIIDAVGVRTGDPLTRRAASLVPAVEAALVIAVMAAVVMSAELPTSFTLWRLAPGSIIITVIWVVGVWTSNRAQKGLTWGLTDKQSQQEAHDQDNQHDPPDLEKMSNRHAILLFCAAAVATLVGGVVLERSGDLIAGDLGISGIVFGATFLAASSALPELSTGIRAVKLHNYRLAVSDIFGGNALLPVLFVVATLVSGKAVLPRAQAGDLYLTGLGMLVTAVYIFALVLRPKLRVLGIGIDGLTVVAVYIVGIVGLIIVAAQ
jgi:cation:H+ antiporter